MSGLGAKAVTGAVALSAATAKTVVQITAPTNHRLKLLRYKVTFDGTSSSAVPVAVRLIRQTTAGTMSALTPVKKDPSLSETIQTTAQHTATVEPTNSDVIDSQYVHPQGGYEFLLSQDSPDMVGGGGRVGIECNAPATVNVRAMLEWDE